MFLTGVGAIDKSLDQLYSGQSICKSKCRENFENVDCHRYFQIFLNIIKRPKLLSTFLYFHYFTNVNLTRDRCIEYIYSAQT